MSELALLSTHRLQELVGTNTPVFCRAGGMMYEGRIRSHISTSQPPDDEDRFSFFGNAVERPSNCIRLEGRHGDFFVLV